MVVLSTPEAMKSRFVHREIEYALEKRGTAIGSFPS